LVRLYTVPDHFFVLDERPRSNVKSIRCVRPAQSRLHGVYIHHSYLFAALVGGQLKITSQYYPAYAGNCFDEGENEKGRTGTKESIILIQEKKDLNGSAKMPGLR